MSELTATQKSKIDLINTILPIIGIDMVMTADNVSEVDKLIEEKFNTMESDFDPSKYLSEISQVTADIQSMIGVQIQQKTEMLTSYLTTKITDIVSEIAKAVIPGGLPSIENPTQGITDFVQDTVQTLQDTKTKIELTLLLNKDAIYCRALKAYESSRAKQAIANHKKEVLERAQKRQSKIDEVRKSAEEVRKKRQEQTESMYKNWKS